MSAADPLAALTKGSTFPSSTFALSDADVEAYLAATGDRAFSALGDRSRVPPLAAAALVLKAMLESFDLPPGAVHTGEEIEFARPIAPGEPIRCETKVTQSSDRQGYRFATVEQRALDSAGEAVLVARASVLAPLASGDGS